MESISSDTGNLVSIQQAEKYNITPYTHALMHPLCKTICVIGKRIYLKSIMLMRF